LENRCGNATVLDGQLVHLLCGDLAVVKARKLPDDLESATLGSTANLRSGDEVVAVGFPFGIGPSVSAGVIFCLTMSRCCWAAMEAADGQRLLLQHSTLGAVATFASTRAAPRDRDG